MATIQKPSYLVRQAVKEQTERIEQRYLQHIEEWGYIPPLHKDVYKLETLQKFMIMTEQCFDKDLVTLDQDDCVLIWGDI